MYSKGNYSIDELVKILEEIKLNKKELSSIKEEVTEILEALKELNYDNELALNLINRLEEIIL